jgi:hypothetical protein
MCCKEKKKDRVQLFCQHQQSMHVRGHKECLPRGTGGHYRCLWTYHLKNKQKNSAHFNKTCPIWNFELRETNLWDLRRCLYLREEVFVPKTEEHRTTSILRIRLTIPEQISKNYLSLNFSFLQKKNTLTNFLVLIKSTSSLLIWFQKITWILVCVRYLYKWIKYLDWKITNIIWIVWRNVCDRKEKKVLKNKK